jgi:spore coat polysaccharide biosynthesis protein SpsF
MSFKTEQEKFWAGQFGDEYIQRNQGDRLLASNLNFFTHALNSASQLGSCIEFGANVGMNLRALKLLYPDQEQYAVEINANAALELEKVTDRVRIFNSSILNYEPQQAFDLVLIKGVLIHINPDELPNVYDRLFAATGKYLLIAEYYNPSPVSVPYRGHHDRLFKRDFAGELLDRYKSLVLADYGFVYHRDPKFPQDDITWFLLEKRD